jgi:hypothetical protein
MDDKVPKAFHKGGWPMLTPMPQCQVLGHSWYTQETTYYHTPCKGTSIFCLAHSPAEWHTYTIHVFMCVCIVCMLCVCMHVSVFVALQSLLFHKVYFFIWFLNLIVLLAWVTWCGIEFHVVMALCSTLCLPSSVLDLGTVKRPPVAGLVGYAWMSELCASSSNRQFGAFNMSIPLTHTVMKSISPPHWARRDWHAYY